MRTSENTVVRFRLFFLYYLTINHHHLKNVYESSWLDTLVVVIDQWLWRRLYEPEVGLVEKSMPLYKVYYIGLGVGRF